MSGNETGFPEAEHPEIQETLPKSQPDAKEKTEAEVKASGKEEEIHKENNEIKKPINDMPKTDKSEPIPDITPENDLSAEEKLLNSDMRRLPYFYYQTSAAPDSS